jgi:hypothetical protein
LVGAQKSHGGEEGGIADVLEAWFTIPLMFAAMTRSLDGTLVAVKPTELMVRAESQFQTFAVARRVVVERESSFAGHAAATTARIELADLTPGEYARLQIDAQGQVTHARAVALVEPAKVRSVRGSNVVLEDGTTLTIGSVLRFVNEKGKPSATATVRPGDSVLLFRHPQTGNIYRFSAEPRVRPVRKRRAAS